MASFFSFFLVKNKAAYSTLYFKWKEENIQAHIDTIFLLRATTVHMFLFATITIQHRNAESALYHEYCWKGLFRIINSLMPSP